MSQKGLVQLVAIIGFVILAGALGYFVVLRRIPLPSPTPSFTEPPTPTSTLSPAPPPRPSAVPEPTAISAQIPAQNPPKAISTCDGISNNATVELDGRLVESLKLATGSGDMYETINGGSSFDLEFSATEENYEKVIFIGALRLGLGRQEPQESSFHIEYREYDRSTLPYTYLVGFIAKTMTGQVETKVIAVNPGEHVCGSFDVTGTGNYGVGTGFHTVRVTGNFNQVLPFPRTGSQ